MYEAILKTKLQTRFYTINYFWVLYEVNSDTVLHELIKRKGENRFIAFKKAFCKVLKKDRGWHLSQCFCSSHRSGYSPALPYPPIELS